MKFYSMFSCVLFILFSANAEAVKLGGLDNLAYFVNKVRSGEKCEICFLGGSITQGAGASKYANNYYWRTRGALLRKIKKYKGKAHFFNAGIGGTGSQYACYRLGAQVLSKKPDLLIVEFAVNDSIASDADMTMECLVRQALRSNPKMGIVLFYTTTAKLNDKYYMKGVLPKTVIQHHKVAKYYGLAEVSTGFKVCDALKKGLFTSKTFFKDGTHPSDKGHAFYAKILTDALMPMFDMPTPKEKVKTLPPPLYGGDMEYARLDSVIPIGAHDGWKKKNNQWNWCGVPIWRCQVAGKPLTFKVKGKGVKIIFIGKIKVEWNVAGSRHSQKLSGLTTMPMPAQWSFPSSVGPEPSSVTVTALPDVSGKTRGEVWGYFSIQAPK